MQCATDETEIKQPEKYRVIFYKKLKKESWELVVQLLLLEHLVLQAGKGFVNGTLMR